MVVVVSVVVWTQGIFQTRIIENFAPYYYKCDYFSNIFYVSELGYIRLLSSVNPMPPSSIKGSLYGLISLSPFIIRHYVYEKRWNANGSGPRYPSSRAWFFP